ncbi:segregation and condensation protein A [Miniphocaeibacter halophilus]|uniref:Segregation/condensation protein A n=1 Tax=Miniphocaeibacter halophilus TaxID=2931922 RepID=A0AC61MPS9_9FIRM|nr:segregation/condensation protein A [Miniphocaeibacter halophilus]QQK07557.1 segregation/condensation protein A [Miniphocaeibacter halophilus]
MTLNIDTEFYNGPFDLLLKLIEKNKIDIYDVFLSDITEQFLLEVETLKIKDPENITEFIYLASTLLEIKSRKLLPKNEYLDEEEEITEEILLGRLIEYKKFKKLSKEFIELKKNADYYLPKFQEDFLEYTVEEVKNDIIGDSNLLLQELLNLLERNRIEEENLKKFEIIRAEEYSVEEYMENIQWKLEGEKKLPLTSFIEKNGTRQEIIVVFLSILELIKTKVVKVVQEDVFSEIIVELR